MFSVYPSICLASSGYNSLYSFLFSGYGIQKLSFQGVQVVPHRRGLLEISLKAKLPIFFKLSSVFAFLQKIIQTTLLVVWIIAYFHKIGFCRGIFSLLPIPLCVPILSDLLENIKSEELEGDRKRIGTFLIGKKTIKIQSDAADL